MRPSEAQKILDNPEDHTVQERKDAKAVMAKVGTPLKRNKGGDTPGKKKGKVPVIAISVGMAEMPKNKKNKAAMMRGGMANGKQHMYAAGGVVNDGLKALKASGPKGLEAFNKITGK